jgi:hypothetical protein
MTKTGTHHATTIDSPDVAAAVITINAEIHCTPYQNPTGRVSFMLDADPDQTLQKLYAGEKVILRDYMRNLKELRSAIFSLKSR